MNKSLRKGGGLELGCRAQLDPNSGCGSPISVEPNAHSSPDSLWLHSYNAHSTYKLDASIKGQADLIPASGLVKS